MVNLIGLYSLVQYDTKPCINLLIENELREKLTGVLLFKDLAPSEDAQSILVGALDFKETWEFYKSLYEEQLKTAKCVNALQTIVFLEQIYQTVNIITYEARPERSHRSLLVDVFDDLQVQIHLG